MHQEDYNRPQPKRKYDAKVKVSCMEWINVDESLPTHTQYVLVAGKYKLPPASIRNTDRDVKYCIYDALESEFICQKSGDVEYIKATHWMPLPSPPEL